MVNESIFKSYDIRGIYPGELNEEIAESVGRAFIFKTKAKKIAIARDGRLSSDQLFKAVIKGVLSQGADVYDIGQFTTEGLYFSVGFYDDIDAGIMITASHNPKEYGGIKMVKKEGSAVTILRGIDLLEFVKQDIPISSIVGKVKGKDVWDEYIKHILSFVDTSKIKPFKIAVDASNGVGGKTIEILRNKLPVKIFDINFEIDGNFPNHSPNPIALGSSDQIEAVVKEKNLDFGFIFDADADRIFLVDENGTLVRADMVLLLLAKYFLLKNPGLAISYNAVCSRAVPKFIKEWGGRPIRTKVGFVYVQRGMMENNGIMGGELAGHYCFRDNYYLDSGGITFLSLLELISLSGKKVSELVKECSIYYNEPAIEFKTNNGDKIIEILKKKYSDGKQDELDGITVEYDNYWFNVRASQTEPIMRLTLEANTKEIFDQKKEELTKIII